jgi:hypothetical protein
MLSSEFVGMASNWNGNWGQYSNPQADELIAAIPSETDPAKLKEIYTELVKIYLTNVPSFTLMYRPQSFHTVNESVWNSFLRCRWTSTVPPVRPLNLTDGWSTCGSQQRDARAVIFVMNPPWLSPERGGLFCHTQVQEFSCSGGFWPHARQRRAPPGCQKEAWFERVPRAFSTNLAGLR